MKLSVKYFGTSFDESIETVDDKLICFIIIRSPTLHYRRRRLYCRLSLLKVYVKNFDWLDNFKLEQYLANSTGEYTCTIVYGLWNKF